MWPLKTPYALLPADNDSSISDTEEATEKSTKEYRVGASRAHMVVLYIFSIALAVALLHASDTGMGVPSPCKGVRSDI
jgi:hypothetical protein